MNSYPLGFFNVLEQSTLDKISFLHPKIRSEVISLLEQAELAIDSNLRIRVIQGMRSIIYQDALYAQGRTRPGAIVTKAKGGSSLHNYGLAVDLCWLLKQGDGTFKYQEKESWVFGPNYDKVVKIFKDAGYTWGGDWKSIKDNPHFEKDFGLGWRGLYKKYTNKDFITGTEYVNI